MKLKNKKTGEVGNLVLNINPNRESYSVLSTENGDTICGNLVVADYDTLTELNEEWEDYEEPEGWWFINRAYEPNATNSTLRNLEADKEIGNYFEAKGEAEKAVEKLKAWKRLKDNGFKFTAYQLQELNIKFFLDHGYTKMGDDLDLLFGGEE